MRYNLILIFCLFLTQFSWAHPYRATLVGRTKEVDVLSKQLKDGTTRRSSPNHIVKILDKNKFNVFVPGGGRFTIRLNQYNFKDWESTYSFGHLKRNDTNDIILVNGRAKKGNKSFVFGGSIYNKKKKPTLNFILQSHRKNSRSFHLSGNIINGTVITLKVSAIPSGVLKKLGCSTEDLNSLENHHNHQVSANQVVSSNNALKIATMATEADQEWFSRYGANSNTQIATLISHASAIYQQQIGVKFQISAQNVYTSSAGSPYQSTNANTLLTAFRSSILTNGHLGTRNLYHLFTGKDLDGSTVGLAYVGVVCSFPDFSFGLTQALHPAADASIVAHEIGHNFAAGHDSSDNASLMAPFVSIPGSTYFSQFSVNQILNHLNTAPSCLVPENNQPTPTPTPPNDNPGNGDQPTPTPDPMPSVQTQSTVTSSGILTINVRLSGTTSSDCKVELNGSTKANIASQLLTQFSPKTTTVIRLAGLKRPRRGATTLFFNTIYSCNNGQKVGSNTSSVNLNSIRQRTTANINSILKAIKKSLRS